MREVQSGHRKQDIADKIVGQRLADVYVQPLVDKWRRKNEVFFWVFNTFFNLF